MYRKVLFTASSFAHICSFHIPYLEAFKKAGSTVHVACGGKACELSAADKLISVPFEKRMTSFNNLRAAMVLQKLMAAENYDLIITHTSLAAFFTRMAVSRLRQRPKVIYMCHGYLFDDESPASRRMVLLLAERLVAGQTDLLLNMNTYDFQIAKKFHLGKKICLIPGVGVDFEKLAASSKIGREQLRQELFIPKDAYVIFYAAEFSKRKNQAFLIRAMSRLPDSFFLVLAGDGDLLDSCKQLAHRLGVSKQVRFPGHVSPVVDWYKMADVAVSSSRSEGLPFNIMEAMHLGLPIVASNVKGNSDLIKNDVNGLLYPLGNEAEYISCILRLFHNPALADHLRQTAVRYSNDYDLSVVFPEVWTYYSIKIN